MKPKSQYNVENGENRAVGSIKTFVFTLKCDF